jgi:hypothetical protein
VLATKLEAGRLRLFHIQRHVQRPAALFSAAVFYQFTELAASRRCAEAAASLVNKFFFTLTPIVRLLIDAITGDLQGAM